MATSTPTNQPADDNWLGDQAPKLPATLNVLTWLTFVWNGLLFVLSFVGFFGAQANYERTLKTQDALDSAPSWAKKMAGPHPVETARAMLDNRLPVLIIGLLACFLCFFGALQMRKLKKTGFSIYVLGDLVSYAIGIFIGFDTFASFGSIFGIIITVVFVILYATQLKAMK
jgi:hypothetical protein